jgi:hypothetical protein
MYHYYGNIKSSLMGYKKSQVDRHIKDQLYNNSAALSELSLRVLKLEGDKKQLESTSSKLKQELMSYYDDNLPVNLFTDLYEAFQDQKKSQPTKVVIRKVVDDTAASAINGTVDTIKQNLGTLSEKVDSLTDNIAKMMLIQNNSFAPIASIKPISEAEIPEVEIPEAEIPEAEVPAAATLESSVHIVTERTTGTTASMEITGSEALTSPTWISSTVELTATSEASNVAVTAEKSKVETIDFHRDATGSKKAEHPNQRSEKGKVVNFNRINTVIAPSVINSDSEKKQVNSFFGVAVNEYPNTQTVSFSMNATELLENTEHAVDSIRFNSFFENLPVSRSNTPKKNAKTTPEVTKIAGNSRPPIPQLQQESTDSIANTGVPKTELNEDAKYIRQKYIVGKIAGDDLYDRNGKLIIGRRSPITPAVVEYADREGKLPELIVHMILRDME